MSSKISALPASAVVRKTDLFTFARPPGNFSVVQDVMLTAEPGAEIKLESDGGKFTIDALGDALVDVVDGFTIQIAANPIFDIDVTGNVSVSPPAGAFVSFIVDTASFVMDAAGNVQLIVVLGATLTLSYHPSTPGDWSGSPSHVWEALDRLAAAVAGLLGGPIP